MPTQIPSPTFGPNGVILPLESAIVTGAKADINAALGGSVNMSDTTPQGQIAVTLSAIVADKNNQFLLLSNNFDPAFAQGRFQDGLARIYFIDRIPAVATVVVAQCTGVIDTPIPAGTYAVDTSQRLWISLADGTIVDDGTGNGTVNIEFSCTILGPIVCPIGTLTTPYKSIDGWERITNSAAGIIGRNVETSAQFEQRRYASVAINSSGSAPSVRATVLAIDGVSDCCVIENDTGNSTIVGGYTLNKNSLFVAVVGGNLADIAKAVWIKKAPGCGYSGNTTITVYDDASYYQQPYPSYAVTLCVPTVVPIFMAITLVQNEGIPSTASTLIIAAIISAFTGADGGTRATIGSLILASRYYSGILMLGSWAEIDNIVVGVSMGSLFNTVQMNIDQVPVISADSITINLGTPVSTAATITISDGSLT
jgi:hypothetical protein